MSGLGSFNPTPDEDIAGNDGPVVGRAPSLLGIAGQAAAERVGDSAVGRAAGGAPARVRGLVDSRVVRGPLESLVESVGRDARMAGVVARDIAASAPADARRVARAGVVAGAVAAPVVRAVSDRAFAGVPSSGEAAAMGGRWVAGFFARLASGEWLRNGWGRYAGRWRMQVEDW